MIDLHRLAIALVLPVALASCAYTSVKRVDFNDTKQRGIRVYDPKPVLIVNCDATTLAFLPDFSRGYTVQPRPKAPPVFLDT